MEYTALIHLYFSVQFLLHITSISAKIALVMHMNTNFIITDIHRVILVGKEEYPEPRTVFSHNLSTNELIFHFSGNDTVYFNGKTLHTEENTIRFLPAGETREYIVERHAPGECIDIFFNTDVPVSEEAFVLKITNSTALGNYFKKLFALWVAKNDGYYFESISLLYKIFAELQKQNYIPENQYKAIKPALDYIEEHFLTGKISVPDLAKRCQISESYLKKLFIKKFGIPPVKYIIQMKINYACDLLSSQRYTVTQVSAICGYENPFFFSRQFKEYAGISPTDFASKCKSSK